MNSYLCGVVFGTLVLVLYNNSYALEALDLINEEEALPKIEKVAVWNFVHSTDIPSGCAYNFVHDAVVCP